MSKTTIKGLDKLQRQLDELQRKVEKASGTHEVPIEELLTPDFMLRFTNFSSAQEMFDASGLDFETQEDFDALPVDQLDAFIAANTQFNTWDELVAAAGTEYVQRLFE